MVQDMNPPAHDFSIYISGPIGNAGKCTPADIIKNVELAEDIYGELIKKGWNPECPHMSYYPDKRWRKEGTMDLTHKDWLALDKQKVWKCKYFFYMKPEIYGDSHGAEMELEWAKQWGKRIYTDLREIADKIEVPV